MADLLPFPKTSGPGGGGDDVIEARVTRLETDLREIASTLKDVSGQLTELRLEVKQGFADQNRELAELDGEIRSVGSKTEGFFSRVPSTQQLWAMTIGSWIAGAGIVLVAVRLLAS